MKKISLLVLIVIVLLSLNPAAFSATEIMTFDVPPIINSDGYIIHNDGNPYSEGSYYLDFTAQGPNMTRSNPGGYYELMSEYDSVFMATTGAGQIIRRIDGQRFSLTSIDVGSWFDIFIGSKSVIWGLRSGFSIVEVLLTQNPNQFTTYTFGSEWNNLDGIMFRSDQLVDNVHLSATVVPEPISSTLFIVGGATLAFRRFKKKKT